MERELELFVVLPVIEEKPERLFYFLLLDCSLSLMCRRTRQVYTGLGRKGYKPVLPVLTNATHLLSFVAAFATDEPVYIVSMCE